MLVSNVTQVKQLHGVRIIISSAILMCRKGGKGLKLKCFVIFSLFQNDFSKYDCSEDIFPRLKGY